MPLRAGFLHRHSLLFTRIVPSTWRRAPRPTLKDGGPVTPKEIATAEEMLALIWTRDEIAELVSRSGNSSETLTNIVNLIQQRFATDVCSVYLLEPDRANLVLAATIGLRPESVGRVRMRLTEGLVGLVAEQVRPVVVHDTTTHPRFKYFRDAGEDRVPDVPRRAGDGPRRAAGRARRADGGGARVRRRRRPDAGGGRRAAGADRQRGAGGRAVRRAGAPAAGGASRRTCGGAGTTRASACSAISTRSSGASCDHNPIALLQQHRRSISSSCARRSWRSTAASTTPTGGCRST